MRNYQESQMTINLIFTTDDIMNQQRNEKLLKSSVNINNYKFQSLWRISAKIALQLKDNEWREVH